MTYSIDHDNAERVARVLIGVAYQPIQANLARTYLDLRAGNEGLREALGLLLDDNERLRALLLGLGYGRVKSVGMAQEAAIFQKDAAHYRARAVNAERERDEARAALRDARSVLVRAFDRIHGLPRTADTELAKAIETTLGRIRGE